jgi:RHS repeat-associated protein
MSTKNAHITRVFYHHSDHLGSAAYLTNDAGQVSQTLNYLPYGEDWVDLQYGLDYRLGQYTFNGKEKDPESGFHYYGARYYWSELLTGWLSVDPMADKYPGISPYAYCAWNPAILVDPDGKNDRPFRDGDKHVHDIQGTATFIMTNLIGFMQVFSSYSILNTYNCHSFAWHGSWGDKNPASGDIPYDQYGITSLPRWDQNPADDIRDVINRGGRQLGSDEDNIIGDRVIYFTDHNENGMYDDGEFISHSAIVTAVDDKCYTI